MIRNIDQNFHRCGALALHHLEVIPQLTSDVPGLEDFVEEVVVGGSVRKEEFSFGEGERQEVYQGVIKFLDSRNVF